MLHQNTSIPLQSQANINRNFHSNGSRDQMQNSSGKSRNHDIMKFLDSSSSKCTVKPTGKRCFSNSNAVSRDSPDHFNMLKTLMVTSMSKKIDLKSHQNPEFEIFNSKLNTERIGFNPHKNYFSVCKQGHNEDKKDEFLNEYSSTIEQISKPFNRKISDYSRFINQNIKSEWNTQYPLMGGQRNSEGRRIRNIQRDSIIDEKMRTKESFLKTFHTNRLMRNGSSSQNSQRGGDEQENNRNLTSMSSRNNRSKKQLPKSNNHLLFSEKSRLRTNRNEVAKQLHEDTDSYMVKAKRSGLESHHSSQLYKTSEIEPEPTSNLGSPSRSIKYTTFDTLITKYRSKNQRGKVRTNFQADIAHESNRQMIASIEKWTGQNHLQRLPQCSSPSRNIKRSQKSQQA